MDLSINLEDFNKICRICLQLSEILISISLYEIINMFKECASVDISEDDELPPQICQICFTRLQDSFNFKTMCQKSNYDLRRVIAEHKKNKPNEGLVQDCDEKPILLKNEVFSIDDELKDFNLETLSIKSENLSAGDQIENNYNDETLSLKNEECRTDDEKNNENIQDEKASLLEKIQINTNMKTKTRTKHKKEFICEKCERKFDTPWHLGWHCKSTHKATGTKCSYCDVICYHSEHLKFHEESHSILTIKCEDCGKEFASKIFFASHIYTHKTDRPFKCQQCDSAFKTKCSLKIHMKVMHTFDHRRLSTCHICNKTVKYDNMKLHLRVHAERNPLDCSKCGKKFVTNNSLRTHFRLFHENGTQNLCSVCGYGTKTEADLVRHMRTHTGEKPYQCDKCEKRYPRADALKIHVRNVHLNERKHVCSICSEAFHVKAVLENHMRRHTGERPFACFVCGKTFCAKVSMQHHLKRVHKAENLKK